MTEPITASKAETRAAGNPNTPRTEGRGPAAEARSDSSAEAGSHSAPESWTNRAAAAEARAHGGETARASTDSRPAEPSTAETGTPAEPPASETSVAAEAAASEAAMTAAEAPASMTAATSAATPAAATRRGSVNHRHPGQCGRGESRN